MHAIEPTELNFCLRWADAETATNLKEMIEAFYGSKVTAFEVIVSEVSLR